MDEQPSFSLTNLLPSERHAMTLPEYLNALRDGKIKPPPETALGTVTLANFETPELIG